MSSCGIEVARDGRVSNEIAGACRADGRLKGPSGDGVQDSEEAGVGAECGGERGEVLCGAGGTPGSRALSEGYRVGALRLGFGKTCRWWGERQQQIPPLRCGMTNKMGS